MYGACRLLGARRAAALVAGTAYQLAPFVSADLYARGSYTEFAALTAAPVVLYWALRLARSRTRREALNRLCLCGLALAYFVPLHPVQTLLCGGLIGVVAATHALIDRRASWPALAKLAAAGVLGVTGSAWFWVPVVRDYHDLRIVAHGALLDAGLADPAVLLWPGFREAEGYPWAPQLGFHFALAAVLVLIFRKDARSTGLVAATALLAIVSVVLFHERLPTVQRLLTPLQWTYRLLVPATLAGSVCLALALTAVLRRINDPAGRGLAIGVTIAYVLATSVPYFLGPRRWVHTARVRNVVSPEWLAPNSDPYALRGTDYARLGIVRADGTLNVNTDLAIRPDGVATDLRILLRTPAATPAAGGAPVNLTASVGTGPSDLRQEAVAEAEGPSHARLTFTIRPRVGHQPGDSVVRFNAPAAAAAWLVEDLTFRASVDDVAMVCRVPEFVRRHGSGKSTDFDVDVPTAKEGLYQLPVYVLPSNAVTVNGRPVPVFQSSNRAFVIVPLRTGTNAVKIRTRPDSAAWAVSVVAVAAMVAGPGAIAVVTRRTRRGRGVAAWS